MSEQGANLIKELHQILNRFFNWLITVIALMSCESGKALFKANYSAMMGVVSTTCAYFLVCVAATMLQRHITNFFPIAMILLLQCVISVLTLSVISCTISFVALALWPCVFGFIWFCKRRELYQLIPSKFKRSNEGVNPQSPPSLESDIIQSPPSPESNIPQSWLFRGSSSPGSQLSLKSPSLVSDGIVSPPLLASDCC